ncbi:MAG: hypothetical protein ABID61_05740 [Candidatus Micrarchaeota archaeon]
MKIMNVIIGIIAILILILGGIIVILLLSGQSLQPNTLPQSSFTILETGTAGDYGYAVYNYRGNGNLTILSYNSQPKRNITIINDSQAIQSSRLPELVSQLKTLEKYGYEITVSNEPKIGTGITIIPSGALPSYALFNLQQPTSQGTIVYIGAKNLILSTGIKEVEWFNMLSTEQQQRIIIYDGTLDEILETQISFADEVLYNKWMLQSNDSVVLSSSGAKSSTIPMGPTGYLRLVYDFDDLHGIYDSPYLKKSPQILVLSPQSIYPWEKSSLQFELNKTEGAAVLIVKRNGDIIQSEELRTVTDQNVFIKKLEYDNPGEYTIFVDDDSGNLASGLLHIKDMQVSLLQKRGVSYVFLVTVDDKPLTNTETTIWLGNSSITKKYYVTNGEVVVNANLNQGENIFNFEINGRTMQVVVNNKQENLFDFYTKYGLLAFIIIIVVYFGARMTRRPTYRLRFGDSSTYIRQEIKLPLDRALECFKKIRHDMHLGMSPITTHEFTVSLKRYLTNGADITEGNVEEILDKLVKSNYLKTHRDYYQLEGEGDVKRNVLRRIIREKLIESGTVFKEHGGKFVLKDREIGFFGERFSKKAIIIVDDESEIKQILSSLKERDRASIKIAQTNDILSFVTIDKLSGLL